MKLNSMVRKLFLVCVMAMISLTTIAQPPGRGQWQNHQERLESQKVAFITRELDLSIEEAQIFWPVYNDYMEKRNELMIKHRAERERINNPEELKEEELVEIANSEIENMEEMTALRRQYHDKFMEILPVLKVVKLYKAERDFNRNLLREKRRGGPPGGRN
ncbi:MAG: hypothetical protein ACLFQS_09015 [Bacteroidales bacterium]